MTPSRATKAMQRGMAFIESSQKPNGAFDSFSSNTKSPFQTNIIYQTVFGPALILAALTQVDDSKAQHIRTRLAAWLLTQKSLNWSFNYWATSAPERASLPYPDDLDDTFCAIIALQQHDSSIIDESCLARVVKLLIATESKVGGPYQTWLAADDAPKIWHDVDLAVNANIAGFLRLVAEPLPNLTSLMEEAIVTGAYKSPYYPSPYPLVYYIARAYSGPRTQELAAYLVDKQRDEWWENPTYTALAISALVRLGHTSIPATTLEKLLDNQLPDGSWSANAFCIDPAILGKTNYGGSPALTTALVLEALALCQKTQPAKRPKTKSNADTVEAHCNVVMLAARKELHSQSPELKRESLDMLDHMAKDYKDHQIIQLPYIFNRSLIKPLSTEKADLFLHLGLANLYGWTAYTIYDDFLDNEGRPRKLSVANITLRYSLKHFRQALPNDMGFLALTDKTFDAIDGANAWELAHCRMDVTDKTINLGPLPQYPSTLQLADRSLGHTLTPLGVLAAAGIPPQDKRATGVRDALRHYIVARQLNDDLHDWEQDFRAGIITYVIASILRELSVAPGIHSFTKLLPDMQRHFWHHTMPDICSTITVHTQQARQAATSSTVLTEPNVITMLADAIDQSVEHTLSEHAKAENFLSAYRTPIAKA